MLILTRRFGEVIRIGDDIKIVVLSKCNQQIKLGIDAPDEVPVHREEIYQRILKEREENEPNQSKKSSIR